MCKLYCYITFKLERVGLLSNSNVYNLSLVHCVILDIVYTYCCVLHFK